MILQGQPHHDILWMEFCSVSILWFSDLVIQQTPWLEEATEEFLSLLSDSLWLIIHYSSSSFIFLLIFDFNYFSSGNFKFYVKYSRDFQLFPISWVFRFSWKIFRCVFVYVFRVPSGFLQGSSISNRSIILFRFTSIFWPHQLLPHFFFLSSAPGPLP